LLDFLSGTKKIKGNGRDGWEANSQKEDFQQSQSNM